MYYAVEARRLLLGKILLSPFVLAYRLHLLSASTLRKRIVAFGFRGRNPSEIRTLGASYARERLPEVIRPEALERIGWHQALGDTVVVVSASLALYLSDWCEQMGVDCIATELENKGERLTGAYRDGDCSGAEKARRVAAKYAIDAYPMIYAYGDTAEDEALLSLAHRKFYRWCERR